MATPHAVNDRVTGILGHIAALRFKKEALEKLGSRPMQVR
jgi:hypothetical protein